MTVGVPVEQVTGPAAFAAAVEDGEVPPWVAGEADLRGAMAVHELEAWFQPKIEIRSGRVAGAEAVLRWRHPERGLTRPAGSRS